MNWSGKAPARHHRPPVVAVDLSSPAGDRKLVALVPLAARPRCLLALVPLAARPRCLLAAGDTLLIGHDEGLLAVSLAPGSAGAFGVPR